MNDKKVTFQRFGNDFQEKLAYLILRDRTFAEQFEEVLDMNYFEIKHLQLAIKCLFDYKLQYKIHPSLETISILLNEERRKHDNLLVPVNQALEFIEKFSSVGVFQDEKFIKDISLDFCKKQALKNAIYKSIQLLENSSFDSIKKVIDEACKLGIEKDLGHDLIKDFEERFKDSKRVVLETPWPEVNNITGGGFGKGEFHIVVAPTGMGKSHAMIHFGANAISNGYKGVHYTLELSKIAVGKRYDSCITGIDINLNKEAKEVIKKSISDLKGNLIIREWPTKSASVNTIRSHLEKVKQSGFTPDFIIVDYADLLKPINKTLEKRHQLEEINEELRAIAMEFQCVVCSASQANRSSNGGTNAELLTLDSIAEAYAKCFPADFIWTLSRTIKEKEQNLGKFFIAKNRNGPDGLIFKIRVDTSTSTFEILPRTDDDTAVHTPHNNGTSIAERYEKFKQGRR